MDRRGKILGALFLLMFTFGLASLAFQFALDRLAPSVHSSDAAYYVFGTLATAGASGYASLFYFLVRNSSQRSGRGQSPPPPPYDQEHPPPEGDEGYSQEGGYFYMRITRR